MGVASGMSKLATWIIRLIQLFFAIILTGILSYMVHEYHHYGFHTPREVVVPEVFSVLAIFVCVFSIIAVCCLGHMLQLVAAFLDFAIFVGYIASAALLHGNYHHNNNQNPLRNALTNMRVIHGDDSRHDLNSSLVKLLVASVIIQIILFFFTTILGVITVKTTEDRPGRTRHAV